MGKPRPTRKSPSPISVGAGGTSRESCTYTSGGHGSAETPALASQPEKARPLFLFHLFHARLTVVCRRSSRAALGANANRVANRHGPPSRPPGVPVTPWHWRLREPGTGRRSRGGGSSTDGVATRSPGSGTVGAGSPPPLPACCIRPQEVLPTHPLVAVDPAGVGGDVTRASPLLGVLASTVPEPLSPAP